jgi:hypothetical protein
MNANGRPGNKYQIKGLPVDVIIRSDMNAKGIAIVLLFCRNKL